MCCFHNIMSFFLGRLWGVPGFWTHHSLLLSGFLCVDRVQNPKDSPNIFLTPGLEAYFFYRALVTVFDTNRLSAILHYTVCVHVSEYILNILLQQGLELS